MASALMPEMSASDVSTLENQLNSLLWNFECLACTCKGAFNIDNVAPDFGLLICKTNDWEPVLPSGHPIALSEEDQVAVQVKLAAVANAILPADGKTAYQHYETEDGLICALYRMSQKSEIFRAAGLDPEAVSINSTRH